MSKIGGRPFAGLYQMVKRKREETLLDYYERELRRFDEAPFLVGLMTWLVGLSLVLHYLRGD